MPKLSVIVPTHSPRPEFLGRALAALRAQSLPLAEWELVVVDNASPQAVTADLSWHPSGRLVVEPRLGLTRARARGFLEARGDLAVLVDDDNVLDPTYLAAAAAIFGARPFLGTCSGALTLEFQAPALAPPPVYFQFLTTRHPAAPSWSNDPGHNDSTPWGAGMCIRRPVFEAYLDLLQADPRRVQLDLQGATLVYGGDTDIAFTGCALGMGKGVFPELHITHLIPPERCAIAYLLRAAEGQGYSEVLHHYLRTGTLPSSRTDLVGRVGEWVRHRRSSRDERRVASARKRGFRRARQELEGKAASP